MKLYHYDWHDYEQTFKLQDTLTVFSAHLSTSHESLLLRTLHCKCGMILMRNGAY